MKASFKAISGNSGRLVLLFSLLVFAARAQETRVSGRVYDALTNEPIPFAGVVFKGFTAGANADMSGNFVIKTEEKVDSVSASFVGYIPATLPVQRGKSQTINFALRVNKFDLPEVEVKAGENPADILMRKVRENKDNNNRSNVSAYQYESYNKIEFDINNITEKFKKNKLMKPFAFIFDNIDSTTTNRRPFLPVFLTETLSDVYYTKDPKRKKEVIKASKVSGVNNNTISQYLGDFYQNINVYDEYIYLFGKGFVSPLSGVANLYYKYYLLDSATIGDKWCYKLKFKPRRKQELTFNGEVWIHDTTFAVKKIELRIADDANINFIEDMAFVDEYDFIDKKQWMLTRDLLVVNIAPNESKGKETMGFIARKSTSYRDFILDQPKPDSFFDDQDDVNVVEGANKKDDVFWEQARHDTLSVKEKKIYAMVDTLKKLPAFKSLVDGLTILATGYIPAGPIDIGNIYTLYTYNYYEGSRFKLSGRTNSQFSNRVQLNGYVAFGTQDLGFKYGGGIQYFLPDKGMTSFGLSYKNDVEQLGKEISSFNSDNLLLTLLSRIRSNKFNRAREQMFFYETDILKGLTTNLSFYHRAIYPLSNLDFSYYTDGPNSEVKDSLTTSELLFSFRYAYKERFVQSGRKGAVGLKSTRISLGSKYPITTVSYIHGMKDVFGSQFTYDKLKIAIQDRFYLGNFGYTFYLFEAGKVWGTIPYPILEVHKGNETYTYSKDVFNQMNYFEFVSDEFFSAMGAHHFGGVFLDKIPLLRKLKFREVVSARFLVGRISQDNRDILLNPDVFYSLDKPYVEAGVGIENILKFGRVDLIKRFSHLDHPNISELGFRISFSLNF